MSLKGFKLLNNNIKCIQEVIKKLALFPGLEMVFIHQK